MQSTKNLSQLINTFDLYYENSDSPTVWDRGRLARKEILIALHSLRESERLKLRSTLTERGKFAFERYFNESHTGK